MPPTRGRLFGSQRYLPPTFRRGDEHDSYIPPTASSRGAASRAPFVFVPSPEAVLPPRDEAGGRGYGKAVRRATEVWPVAMEAS